jgi:hypothetical protein
MAAGAWTLTNSGRSNMLDALVATADTYKMALFTSASDLGATENAYAGVTGEVANGNGYATGGISVALTKSGTTTVTVVMTTAPVWTVSGVDLVAKFAAIYEVGGNILAYCLLDSGGANVTTTVGNTLTVGANGATVGTLA